ncbi:MAG: hypothetical protein K6F77_00780, partial [Lachnospiraceae bacterium]|nr:hypothetical protein [Lachnospiraceae bacterium]
MKGKIISNTIKKFIVAMLSTALVLGAFPANQSVKKASADEVVNSEEFEADKEGKVEIEKDSIIIPAPGHDYGEPTYEWALDGSVCTACAVCKRDSDHKLIECVKATGVLKTEPTEESMGVTTYTANFENELFETQTIDIEDIPKLE